MKFSILAILFFSSISCAEEIEDVFNSTESMLVSQCLKDTSICNDISHSDVAMVKSLSQQGDHHDSQE